MNLKESLNRGFNLMVTTVLVFGGIHFGTVALSPAENDWGDRLDDVGLLVVGIACLVWLMIGRNRFHRSIAPVVFAGLALAVQALAILLEHDDAGAFGDNIGGLAMLIPFFIFVLIQFVLTGRAILAAQRDTVVEEHTRHRSRLSRKWKTLHFTMHRKKAGLSVHTFCEGRQATPKGKCLPGGVFQLRKSLCCRRYSSGIKAVAVNVLTICDPRSFSLSSQGVTNQNGSSSREHYPAWCGRAEHAL